MQIVFKMQRQAQSQWCWAAVAASVAAFYNNGTSQTQCDLVNGVLGLSDCCTNGSSANCDVPASLKDALRRVGHWASSCAGAASWQDLDLEIHAGRPVAAQISLIGGGAHFVTIVGTGTPSDTKIIVEDPTGGRSTTKLNSYAKSAHGVWRETHFSQP